MTAKTKIKDSSLFSIYIQKGKNSGELPSAVRRHITSFKDHCKHFSEDHYLIGDHEIRTLLASEFEPKIARAYEAIAPHAYKADIARYALLHAHGGIYADLSMQFINPPKPLEPNTKGWLCHGIRKTNISNGFLHCNKGEPLFLRALEIISARIEDQYYGPNPVSITGPRLLYDTIEADPALAKGFRFYSMKALTPNSSHLNMAALDEDGAIICLRNKKKTGGLHELGLVDTDYRKMWEERRVYTYSTV